MLPVPFCCRAGGPLRFLGLSAVSFVRCNRSFFPSARPAGRCPSSLLDAAARPPGSERSERPKIFREAGQPASSGSTGVGGCHTHTHTRPRFAFTGSRVAVWVLLAESGASSLPSVCTHAGLGGGGQIVQVARPGRLRSTSVAVRDCLWPVGRGGRPGRRVTCAIWPPPPRRLSRRPAAEWRCTHLREVAGVSRRPFRAGIPSGITCSGGHVLMPAAAGGGR